MNKLQKTAVSVVSVVMAGCLVFSFGCGGGTITETPKELTASQTVLTPNTDSDGKLSYSSSTTIRANVGDSNNQRTIAYTSALLSGTVTMPDGKSYSTGDLKPAWQSASETLGVQFTDVFQALSSDAQIETAIQNKQITTTSSQYDLVTGSSEKIVNEGLQNSEMWLDLSLYLDYMPNFKAFLQDNPIVYMSLTSNTESGAMYYAPYFDGNNDIEKYELVKKDWVETLLDGSNYTSTETFAGQAADKTSSYSTISGTSASATSYMGTTGSWEVETTDPSNTSNTTTVVVNYGAALTAAKDTTTGLGGAYYAAAGEAYSGASGNIVDIMNAAINKKAGEVTGGQLLKILQEYIDVAYQDASGNAFYSTRSDVFNSSYGAWDVDLLVALSRCVVTNTSLFNTSTASNMIYAITGRQDTTQRLVDVMALGGELYGIRGLESRYQYTYIGADGTLHDSRNDSSTYALLNNLNALVKEGLLYTGTSISGPANSCYTGTSIECLMEHDYAQTQTQYGYYADGTATSDSIVVGSNISSDYNFAPIVTPVSKWDVDGDGTRSDIMRFTESWRSVKNTGVCVPYAAVKDDPEKLAAILTFIDYLYSNDGQIVMSYGPMSTNNTTSVDGWWYGTEVTSVTLSQVADVVEGSDNTVFATQYKIKDAYKSQYFIYDGKVYTGTSYNGTQIPTLTTANMNFYLGQEVNGTQMGSKGDNAYLGSYALNYTNYARSVVGSALPLGNKAQGFEYQCTAACGLDGAAIVATAINNGTIKHVTQQIDANNLWYTEVPTTLPYDQSDATWISENTSNLTSYIFMNTSTAGTKNLMIQIIYCGIDSGVNIANLTDVVMPSSGAAIVSLLNSSYNLSTFEYYMQSAWQDIYAYYNEYISLL